MGFLSGLDAKVHGETPLSFCKFHFAMSTFVATKLRLMNYDTDLPLS